MSKPGIIYRGEFVNTQADASNANDEQVVTVSIYDMENLIDDADDEEIITMEMGENPVRISIVDNTEDKFKVIKSLQAEIIIHSSSQIDISTFATGGDNRYKVIISVNDENYKWFVGYLSVSDIQMDFQPDPNEIILTATDNLELLKNIPLVDYAGDNPRGKYKIIQYLSWALYQTGLLLEIHVIHNVREEDNVSDHLYDVIYLDSKTFEDDINESEDCYTVIEKILGEYCFITQWKGRWYIMSVDEMDDNTTITARFDSLGGFVEWLANVTYSKNIGEGEDLSWIGLPDTPPRVSLELPYQSTTARYDYQYPKEIVDNIDFAQGDTYGIIPVDPGYSAYHIDDWTIGRYQADDMTPQSTAILAYITRFFEDGYEKERYVVVEYSTETNPFTYLRSNPIPVGESDKGTVSVDVRQNVAVNGSGNQSVFGVVLVGDSGTNYVAHASGWNTSAAYGTSSVAGFSVTYATEADKLDWHTATAELYPIPESGQMYILLLAGYGVDANDKHYANLRFDYQPFINGSYARYVAQHHKVYQDAGRDKRDSVVYMSDSPRPLFKGAMFKLDGSGDYVLANRFTSVAGGSLSSDFYPYGYLQAFSAWNQINRIMVKFDGLVDGLQTGLLADDGLPDSPALLHKFILTDTDNSTIDRYFQLLHFEMDLYLCEWSAFLYEVYNTSIGKVYTDDHEFKYISE